MPVATNKLLLGLVLLGIVVGSWAGAIGADGKPSVATPRRLPAHYAKIVTDEQRVAIYAIQDEYAERIETLRQQLDALVAQRDARTREVLTAEQQQALEELLAAEAKVRRVKANTSAAQGAPEPTEVGGR